MAATIQTESPGLSNDNKMNAPDHGLGSDKSLLVYINTIDATLADNNLSARITLSGASVVVGMRDSAHGEQVEFVFKTRAALKECLRELRLYSFAKAYFESNLEILGPFARAIDILYVLNITFDVPETLLERTKRSIYRKIKLILPHVNLRFESDAHYSLSSQGYELFLDYYMQYTCGKFENSRDTLLDAQINKFHLIRHLAEKHLGTLSGRKHLDIGCGWGGVVHYFQTQYGTDSLGISNSNSQCDYAIGRFGAKIVRGDFTLLRGRPEHYDLVTVVGMAEHLPPNRRSELFQVIDHVLSDQGVIYFQCIARPEGWTGGDAYRIAYEKVFPGHYLETREQMERRFEESGYRIVYSSDGAGDYALTTALWASNLENREAEITRQIGQANFRIMRAYLAYASKLFGSGRGSLMRYVLRRRS